jgi:hypothetical protein
LEQRSALYIWEWGYLLAAAPPAAERRKAMNIEEIKARTETAREEGFGLQQFDDLDSLISEVERLTSENEQNANYAEIYQDICDKYSKNFRVLLDKAKAFQAENATLKKALELAEDMLTKMTPYKSKSGWHDRLIQQAQQLTHETHGESEADHV